jgi:tripartite-type tricarboxylate transporter receptor subunit TctC
MIVAQSSGGNADFVSRAYAQRLAERFGQQIVIDNRPGAAGRTRAVNRVPACGM